MDNNQFKEISQEKFELVQRDESIFDTKFETKPIGYLKDALIRFRKNKASVGAFFVLILLVLFALIVPIMSNSGLGVHDPYYQNVLPKSGLTDGTGFWDGTKREDMAEDKYLHAKQIPGYIAEEYGSYVEIVNGMYEIKYYEVRVDTYAIGYEYLTVDQKVYDKILAYEEETNIQILYPLFEIPEYYDDYLQKPDANWFYETEQKNGGSDRPLYNDNGELIHLPYILNDDGSIAYSIYNPASKDYRIRVLYNEYYYMQNGHYAKYVFGANKLGEDIMVRLAIGARFSLLLGLCVSLVNIIIGICYGAIEGYYGGTVDLILERVSDILSQVPFMIIAVLFNLYLSQKVGILPTLAFAFILTGWIGTASRVRMQFYRYKGQEYVLAARTLGAKDGRLIFRHILPNAIGTIITSCILMIPSVIFSESSLSYLGVIDLSTDANLTSVGTVLQEGQGKLADYPHMLLFPALFIALLMISFNIFGRGLRDAFNPSLRGVEE